MIDDLERGVFLKEKQSLLDQREVWRKLAAKIEQEHELAVSTIESRDRNIADLAAENRRLSIELLVLKQKDKDE